MNPPLRSCGSVENKYAWIEDYPLCVEFHEVFRRTFHDIWHSSIPKKAMYQDYRDFKVALLHRDIKIFNQIGKKEQWFIKLVMLINRVPIVRKVVKGVIENNKKSQKSIEDLMHKSILDIDELNEKIEYMK